MRERWIKEGERERKRYGESVREREREMERENGRNIEREGERKQAYVLTHPHTPPNTYTRKHSLTDAYIHARIRIPDTHSQTHIHA